MFHNRIRVYRNGDIKTLGFILYWMQQSQRISYNHALEYSIQLANKHKIPLLVLFVLDTNFPEANQRHFTFMIQGLKVLQRDLEKQKIRMIFQIGDMLEEVSKIAQYASILISDFGYLRIQRQWRQSLAKKLKIPFYCLESDIVVPVEQASDKQEYMARTIRPKIERLLDEYLLPFESTTYEGNIFTKFPTREAETVLTSLDKSVTSVDGKQGLNGGYSEANTKLDSFIRHNLASYHLHNKDLVNTNYSQLSPYLHFGQISVLEIVEKVRNSLAGQEAKAAFLEQIIVRRELAINFCYYNLKYDDFEFINPKWASDTLDFHTMDKRQYIYDLDSLEVGDTHDPAWNAAQLQMVKTGYMHNYMRMYWGKKIIEWSESPRHAFNNMLYLNNKYELDGRDPNAFTGIAWCFGNHDTAWKERQIFGKVRYMNYQGLKNKFDINAYEFSYGV